MRIDRFSSLTELVERVRSFPVVEDGRSQARCIWMGGEDNPAHTGDGINLALYGWTKGVERARDIAERVAARTLHGAASAASQEIQYDVVGMAYDCGSVLAGVPEAWLTFAPCEVKTAVRIVSNVTASAGVPGDAMMRRGVAVAALALALQAQGYPVTIDVMQDIYSRNIGRFQTIVRIADAASGSPLDVDRLVFALAHPIMFRGLMRAFIDERQDTTTSPKWNGSVNSNERPCGEDSSHDPVTLFLGGQHLDECERWNDNQAEQWVLTQFLMQTKRDW
jgi:hypothetical protein